MKVTHIISLLILMTTITLSYGCKQNTNMQAAAPKAAQEMTEEQALTMLEKELDGISDQLGVLGKKAQALAPTEQAMFNDKLMSLRREIWQGRLAATSGDIQGSKDIIASLMAQIKALM